ncbi:FAD-binding protein [Candidatus Daviesbacteria bacterium]|nr:FAD-binding protein [Candidatus Daviesbacteria bacterium]
MKTYQFDVVIVGSGPAGVHAAYPLIKAGLKVAIIDGGLDSKKQDKKLSDFLDVHFRETSNAYDLIKQSSYVFNKTYQLLKINSNIEIIQSLAKGGLSQQWHGISDFFSNKELERIGLPSNEIQAEYKEIAKLIKLKLEGNLDYHAKALLKTAESKPNLKEKLYRVPLAFPYRTSSDIEYFKKFKNFTYIPNQLVFTVKDIKTCVKIESRSINKQSTLQTKAGYVILAAGSINTTRILLRSLNLFNYKTTFLTKAHYITACMHPRTFLLRSSEKYLKKSGLGQLVIADKKIGKGVGAFFIQLYRFNPLVIHKVLKHIPLPKIMALPLMSIFAPFLMIADIRFAASESKKRFCRLLKDADKNDVLEISFQESLKEMKNHESEFVKISRQLNSLGLFPLKTVKDYTTSHYAGGVPYMKNPGKISVNLNGRLHQANRIYVADSASWRALPAKAPTLTIMANAARIGKKVLAKLALH